MSIWLFIGVIIGGTILIAAGAAGALFILWVMGVVGWL